MVKQDSHHRSNTLASLLPICATSIISAWFLRDLPYEQQAIGVAFCTAIAMWITEIIPLSLTAVLAPALLTLVGTVSPSILLQSITDPVIVLIFGSLLIAKAMDCSKLSLRVALRLLSLPSITKSPQRLLATMAVVSCGLSLVASNTAVTALMLPIGKQIVSIFSDSKNKFSIAILLALSWGSSIAVGFLVGTPPNLIARSHILRNSSFDLNFVNWMFFGLPINLLLLIACWVILWLRYGSQTVTTSNVANSAKKSLEKLGRINQHELTVLAIVAMICLAWIAPDTYILLAKTSPDTTEKLRYWMAPEKIALLGGILLLLTPVDRGASTTLPFSEAIKIDWGTLLLFAGGIALGSAFFDSGLAGVFAQRISQVTGALDRTQLLILAIVLGVLFSELSSNTASATIVIPMVISLAQYNNLPPTSAILGAGLGASLGFMMPVSTPPNSIVYGSKLIPAKEMMKAGLLLDLSGIFILVVCLRLILPLMGLW